MTTTGAKTPEGSNEDGDFAAYLEAGLNAFEFDFGADLSKEAFGDVNAEPGPLLWLANRLCEGTATVIESVSTCWRRPKID